MQNIVINMCENFHYDRLKIDRVLGNQKYDNNNPQNNNNNNNNNKNVRSAYGNLFSGPTTISQCECSTGISFDRLYSISTL